MIESIEDLTSIPAMKAMLGACEDHGYSWDVDGYGDRFYVELRRESDLGEDFAFGCTVHADASDAAAAFKEEVASYAADFDPEEHAAMWIEAKFSPRAEQLGVAGLGCMELCEDALGIQEALWSLAGDLALVDAGFRTRRKPEEITLVMPDGSEEPLA